MADKLNNLEDDDEILYEEEVLHEEVIDPEGMDDMGDGMPLFPPLLPSSSFVQFPLHFVIFSSSPLLHPIPPLPYLHMKDMVIAHSSFTTSFLSPFSLFTSLTLKCRRLHR